MAEAVSCTASPGNVAFQPYKPTDLLPSDAQGYVELRCTCVLVDCVLFSYNIEIRAGQQGTTAARKMKRKAGAETLNYALYSDVTRLAAWGTDSASVGGLYLLSMFGQATRIPVFGRIYAGQNVPMGDYADAVMVVVTY